jgi:hypothetical protein
MLLDIAFCKRPRGIATGGRTIDRGITLRHCKTSFVVSEALRLALFFFG